MAEDFQGKAAEMMKKVLTIGVGAIFLTEESLRSLVKEFKLPKELLTGVLESASKTKSEFLKSFSEEIMNKVTNKIDAQAAIEEFFARNVMEVNLKINFTPKAGIKKKENSSK